jgi:hypothetical protein
MARPRIGYFSRHRDHGSVVYGSGAAHRCTSEPFRRRWTGVGTPRLQPEQFAMNVSASASQDDVKRPQRPKLREILGPGLITGASDDDPSGNAAGGRIRHQCQCWVWAMTRPLTYQLRRGGDRCLYGRSLGENCIDGDITRI